MGTECLPPCPSCVSFLHPPFKQDSKKGEICSAPRQCLGSRMTKPHLIRIYEFQRPKVPMSGELEWRAEESRSVASLGMTEGASGVNASAANGGCRVGQPPLSGCRMIDEGQVLCAWPPPGFSHPWIGVFTELTVCPMSIKGEGTVPMQGIRLALRRPWLRKT